MNTLHLSVVIKGRNFLNSILVHLIFPPKIKYICNKPCLYFRVNIANNFVWILEEVILNTFLDSITFIFRKFDISWKPCKYVTANERFGSKPEIAGLS